MLVKLHASCSFLHAKKWCWIWILIANAEIDNHLLKSAHLFIVSDDQLTLLNSILSAESLPIFKNPLCLPISPSSSIYRSQKIKNKNCHLLCFYVLLHAPATLRLLCQVEHGRECWGTSSQGLLCGLDWTSYVCSFEQKLLQMNTCTCRK